MDDGQVLLPYQFVKAYLAAFDTAPTSAGGTRVDGDVFKSSACPMGARDRCNAVLSSWADGIAAAICRIEHPRPTGKVLGVHVAGEDVGRQFIAASDAVYAACAALVSMDDPKCAMVLLRMNTNVRRISHLLRAAGLEIEEHELLQLDERQGLALGSKGSQGAAISWPMERLTAPFVPQQQTKRAQTTPAHYL